MATAKKTVRKPASRKAAKTLTGSKLKAVKKPLALKWNDDGEVALHFRKTANGVAIGPKTGRINYTWDADGLILIFVQRVGSGIKIPLPKPKKIALESLSAPKPVRKRAAKAVPGIKIPQPKPRESTR